MSQTLEISPAVGGRKLDWKAILSKLGPFIGLIFVVVLFFFLAIHHSGRNYADELAPDLTGVSRARQQARTNFRGNDATDIGVTQTRLRSA